MKNLSHFAVLVWVVIFSSCKKDTESSPIKTTDAIRHDTTVYVYPTGYNSANAIAQPNYLGVPVYLEPTTDVISESLQSMINLSMQSRVSMVNTHPQYLATSAINVINVIAKSDLYVTFVSESSAYKNTLAYYTYKTNNPPTFVWGGSDNNAMDQVIYILPNVTSNISNGGLIRGNKVKLGSFSPGTSIGFVLIYNGWTGTGVNSNNMKYYSQDNLNPETVNTLKRHSIMLYDDVDKIYLIGFEDLNRQSTVCDNDFDDVVFYVSSTIPNSISNINVSSSDKP
jgi:hypothetical protein